MRYKILMLLISLILSFGQAFCEPMTPNPLISVGISDNSFQRYYYKENTFYATKKLTIIEKNTGRIVKVVEPNIPIKVLIKNNLFELYDEKNLIEKNIQPPLVLSTEKDGFLGIYNLKRAGKPALYRGKIELVKPKCKENMFLTNNVLNLETYLLGVVPNEMPVKFGLEALKAQAVAARNYALRPREKKYHEFDVCDSVACQVYFGANTESPLATQAVNETRGLVAFYKNDIILALYSSTAGGYTESYENAFLPKDGKTYPYLKAVPDNKKTPILSNEENARDFYKSTPDTYDNKSVYFRWTREWTREELEKVLKSGLSAAYKSGYASPELKSAEDFGVLKEIKVVKRGESGKIISMEIITDKTKFFVEKELTIRRLFKMNGKALPSANVIFEQEFDKDNNLVNIKAYGGGYGHGVGMSQFGASAMAEKGKTFDEILQHYYSDIELVLVPIELNSDFQNNIALYDFFLEKKHANLIIENKFSYIEMKVVINGKEFNLKAQPSLSRKYSVDISQYLTQGDNKVYFFYPLDNNKSKSVKVFIELYGIRDDK